MIRDQFNMAWSEVRHPLCYLLTCLFSASFTSWLTWVRIFRQHSPARFTLPLSSGSSVVCENLTWLVTGMWFALLHPKLTFHDNLLCNNSHWPTSNGHFIIYGCNWLQLMWKHYISLLLMLRRCKMCQTGLRVVHANFGWYVNTLNKNRPRYICKEISLCFGDNHSGSTATCFC